MTYHAVTIYNETITLWSSKNNNTGIYNNTNKTTYRRYMDTYN